MTRVYSREEVRSIPIRARRAPGGITQGGARTRARGFQGLEFADFREYEPGDDVGRIDWNVTARLGRPWVRMYLEEHGLPVLVMADVSSSTHFGRGQVAARRVIADIAARLGSAAVWNGCRTGLLLFAERVTKYIPGATGSTQLSNIVRALKRPLANSSNTGPTNLSCALDYVQLVGQRRGLIFLVSDFLCGDFTASLERCAGRQEIVAIAVEDPAGIPDCGLLNLRDLETGLFRQIDTGSANVRASLDAAIQAQREHHAATFRKAGVDCLRIDPNCDYANLLAGFLHRRVK